MWWRGPTHKCLSAEMSLRLNVETEPRMVQFIPQESSTCMRSFTLSDILDVHDPMVRQLISGIFIRAGF